MPSAAIDFSGTSAASNQSSGGDAVDGEFDGTSPQVYQTAGRFRALLTKGGTGNLRDLFREGYRLPRGPTFVPSPDAFTAVTQDATVATLDIWYLSSPTPEHDPALTTMAQQIFLHF